MKVQHLGIKFKGTYLTDPYSWNMTSVPESAACDSVWAKCIPNRAEEIKLIVAD